jgi:phosphate transport system protein
MGGMAESLLSNAIEAVSRRDVALAERTVSDDAKVDACQRELEERAFAELISAKTDERHLREIVTAIKIGVDLERVGDLAKNVARRALIFNREEPLRLTHSLVRMGRIALTQLTHALDSYRDYDAERARRVWAGDEEIDELYNTMFRELLTYMMEDPRTIGFCTHLLFVAKNFERAGDHATNIAETVSYMITGEHLSDDRPKSDETSRVGPDDLKRASG